ncbi:MAG: EF-hand domain-containing protein [Planctomycetota bacterium]|jgi:Ca2+-binding EF-hand superfamily protein
MRKILIVMSLMVLFSFSPLEAQDTPKRIFALMDINKDGQVTPDEFKSFQMERAKKFREARFNQLDTNKDGNISREEFMAVQMNEAKKIGERRFRRIDANKDGVLTEKEVSRRFRLVKEATGVLKQD